MFTIPNGYQGDLNWTVVHGEMLVARQNLSHYYKHDQSSHGYIELVTPHTRT